MKDEPKISVIIPAYNVEQYLWEAVMSAVNQTYQNLEIIIVDDGSTDNTPQICDDLKKTDERIKVIRKENGGPSSARNVALDIAVGDYVGFLDADDRIAPEMYAELLNALRQTGTQVARCGIKRVDFSEAFPSYETANDISVIPYEDALRSVFVNGFMWNKLFDMSLFNGTQKIRFDEKIWYVEDEPVLLECLIHSGKGIADLKNDYYYYTVNPNSISHAPFNFRKLTCLIGFRHMCDLIRQKEPQLSDEFAGKYYSICVGFLTNRTVRASKEHRKQLSGILKTNRHEIMHLKTMTLKFKVAAFAFSFL